MAKRRRKVTRKSSVAARKRLKKYFKGGLYYGQTTKPRSGLMGSTRGGVSPYARKKQKSVKKKISDYNAFMSQYIHETPLDPDAVASGNKDAIAIANRIRFAEGVNEWRAETGKEGELIDVEQIASNYYRQRRHRQKELIEHTKFQKKRLRKAFES